MIEWVKAFFKEYFHLELTDQPIELWALAVSVSIGLFLISKLILRLLVRRLGKISSHTHTKVDDGIVSLIKKTQWWFLAVVAIFTGSLFVDLSEQLQTVVHSALIIALLLQIGLWANSALKSILEHYRQTKLKRDPASVTALNAVGMFATGLLWLAVFLLTLDNLGYDVTALIAGLGVGGVAVALAVQNILGDLFASLSILVDKPFVIGDFLIIDDYMGSVEHVGLKTTRIRSLSGEQLIFSNSDLLKSRLRNYGRMYERRVAFTIGVTYETPREKLKLIPGILQTAIEAQEKTRFDRSHFAKYGDFALNFETVYYVLGPDYNLYMDIQQAINLQLHEQFESLAIDFAYPTQVVHLRGESPATI